MSTMNKIIVDTLKECGFKYIKSYASYENIILFLGAHVGWIPYAQNLCFMMASDVIAHGTPQTDEYLLPIEKANKVQLMALAKLPPEKRLSKHRETIKHDETYESIKDIFTNSLWCDLGLPQNASHFTPYFWDQLIRESQCALSNEQLALSPLCQKLVALLPDRNPRHLFIVMILYILKGKNALEILKLIGGPCLSISDQYHAGFLNELSLLCSKEKPLDFISAMYTIFSATYIVGYFKLYERTSYTYQHEVSFNETHILPQQFKQLIIDSIKNDNEIVRQREEKEQDVARNEDNKNEKDKDKDVTKIRVTIEAPPSEQSQVPHETNIHVAHTPVAPLPPIDPWTRDTIGDGDFKRIDKLIDGYNHIKDNNTTYLNHMVNNTIPVAWEKFQEPDDMNTLRLRYCEMTDLSPMISSPIVYKMILCALYGGESTWIYFHHKLAHMEKVNFEPCIVRKMIDDTLTADSFSYLLAPFFASRGKLVPDTLREQVKRLIRLKGDDEDDHLDTIIFPFCLCFLHPYFRSGTHNTVALLIWRDSFKLKNTLLTIDAITQFAKKNEYITPQLRLNAFKCFW